MGGNNGSGASSGGDRLEGKPAILFSRAPYEMRDFNDLILRLPLGVTGAMHVRRPEASLSIHVPGLDSTWPAASRRIHGRRQQ